MGDPLTTKAFIEISESGFNGTHTKGNANGDNLCIYHFVTSVDTPELSFSFLYIS